MCIPSYQRNLLNTCEALWHLSVLIGQSNITSKKDFDFTLETYNYIMEVTMALRCLQGQGIPLFNETEVNMIFQEHFKEFFDRELSCVVRNYTHSLHST